MGPACSTLIASPLLLGLDERVQVPHIEANHAIVRPDHGHYAPIAQFPELPGADAQVAGGI